MNVLSLLERCVWLLNYSQVHLDPGNTIIHNLRFCQLEIKLAPIRLQRARLPFSFSMHGETLVSNSDELEPTDS